MHGAKKVAMEMGIRDGAAPLLWPCSELEVEGSIVKRTEFYFMPVKPVFTFECIFVPVALFYFLKTVKVLKNDNNENVLDSSDCDCWRAPKRCPNRL